MELTFDGLVKYYDTVKALKGVSFTLTPGVNGLLGPNGAGKSTMMNILSGNLSQTSGRITFNGEDIRNMGKEFRKRLGYMPQQQALYPGFTAAQFLGYMATLRGMEKAEATDAVHRVLRQVELEDVATRKIKTFSGGMKQRVAIARAYAVNPSILLMDEPFGALDAQTRTQLQQELLETWEKEQKTCFFITHDVEEAIILAQKVIIMSARPGRIKEIVDINIPYPRTQETKMSPEFLELKNHIWSQVYQEYLEVRK